MAAQVTTELSQSGPGYAPPGEKGSRAAHNPGGTKKPLPLKGVGKYVLFFLRRL